MYNVEKMSKLFISVFLLQNLIFFFFLNVIFLILIEVAENEMG